MSDQVIVTGGLGFIGANFIRQIVAEGRPVINVDLNTYAGDSRRLEGIDRCRSERLDVASPRFAQLVARERPELIVHFAAESHVTRSEKDPDRFFRSNVEGTRRVLEAAEQAQPRLVVHISTDEVYGPCVGRPPFREDEKQPGEGRATSAYARSKALADDVARSFSERLPVIIARLTNCFGPWQHPEKAVARWTIRAITGQKLPVWGSGRQVRDWMFVEDACEAIRVLAHRGAPGDVYNVGPENSNVTNLEIARLIARSAGREDSIAYLTDYDRPEHDERYAVDASKMRRLGWQTSGGLKERLAQTIGWYRAHEEWWRPLVQEAEVIYDDVAPRGAAS